MVIVAAVDRSERASAVVEEAEIVAASFDESVHVVHVLTRSDFVELGTTRAESGDPIDMDEVRETARSIAKEAGGQLAVPHDCVGLVGDPDTEIIEYANRHDARYIVVTGKKRSPVGKALFGSVAQAILLKADRPVIVTMSS